MLNSRRLGLLGAVISGFSGVASAMTFTPFPSCSEEAKVDSVLKVVQKDATLDPDLAPYLGRIVTQYFPGSCHLQKQVVQHHYLPGEIHTFEYTPQPTPRVYDFTWKFDPPGRYEYTGTVYYSERGEPDSALYRHKARSDSDTFNTYYSMIRYITKPDFQLIQVLLSNDSDSWELVWGDSIVSGPNGNRVYTLEAGELTVSRCGNEGSTYVCEESTTPNGFRPQKSIWYLTQGRKDSLQTWEDGELISTEKYFWSARTAGIRSPRVRASGQAANSVWNEFDIMGRKRLDWTNSDKTRSDRNKAWPPTRY